MRFPFSPMWKLRSSCERVQKLGHVSQKSFPTKRFFLCRRKLFFSSLSSIFCASGFYISDEGRQFREKNFSEKIWNNARDRSKSIAANQTGKWLLGCSNLQWLVYNLHAWTIKGRLIYMTLKWKMDSHNQKKSCQSFLWSQMVPGRSWINKNFIFSNGDLLSQKINQADQVPLDRTTACRRKLIKQTTFPCRGDILSQ